MNHERLFQYDDWANNEEIANLKNAPARAIRLFAHVVGTEWVWLSRLQGTKPKLAVWPELTLDQIATELPQLRKAWVDYLAQRPSGTIEYRNSKGELWTSDIEDVLTHVVMHGAYHRGQIATVMRDAGHTPAYTDYIHCTRIGAISDLSG